MPLYREITYDTSGTKESLNLDPSVVPFNACVGCTLTGTASYKLQYSLSPMTVADANALWFDSGDIPSGTSTSAATGFPYPVTRVRLDIASLVGGSIALQLLQGFSTN